VLHRPQNSAKEKAQEQVKPFVNPNDAFIAGTEREYKEQILTNPNDAFIKSLKKKN
jgi:hypothetical protein